MPRARVTKEVVQRYTSLLRNTFVSVLLFSYHSGTALSSCHLTFAWITTEGGRIPGHAWRLGDGRVLQHRTYDDSSSVEFEVLALVERVTHMSLVQKLRQEKTIGAVLCLHISGWEA